MLHTEANTRAGRQNGQIRNPDGGSKFEARWPDAHVQEGPASLRFSLNFHLHALRFGGAREHLCMHAAYAVQTNRACLNNSLKYYLFGRMVACALFTDMGNVCVAA